MAKVILSGGEFGGVEVDSNEFTDNQLSKIDEQGNQWTYDIELSKPNNMAELIEFVPFDEVQK